MRYLFVLMALYALFFFGCDVSPEVFEEAEKVFAEQKVTVLDVNDPATLDLLKEKAANGDQASQLLFLMFTEDDSAVLLKKVKILANEGNIPAMQHLSSAYMLGEVVEANDDSVLFWQKKLAALGNEEAIKNIEFYNEFQNKDKINEK